MNGRRFHRLRLGALLAALVAVAGCGNDTARTESGRIALGMAKGIAAKVTAGKTPAATPDPEKLAAAAKTSFDGPIIMAQIERTGLLTVLGEYGRNGPVRTYSTPGEQTLALRGGIVIATRGLGHDLMSSDTGTAVALIAGRQAGTTGRSYRFLDGEGRERPLPMRCDIRPGGAQTVTVAGNRLATRQVDETCAATLQTLTVQNSYWVTSDGTVALSRQWIGPELGHVVIQTVRP